MLERHAMRGPWSLQARRRNNGERGQDEEGTGCTRRENAWPEEGSSSVDVSRSTARPTWQATWNRGPFQRQIKQQPAAGPPSESRWPSTGGSSLALWRARRVSSRTTKIFLALARGPSFGSRNSSITLEWWTRIEVSPHRFEAERIPPSMYHIMHDSETNRPWSRCRPP